MVAELEHRLFYFYLSSSAILLEQCMIQRATGLTFLYRFVYLPTYRSKFDGNRITR